MDKILAIILFIIVIGVVGLYGISYEKTPSKEEPGKEPQPPQTQKETQEKVTNQQEKTENLVEITPRGFSPQEITISVGQKVYFVNNDDIVHTVVIPSRAWEQEIDPGEKTQRPPVFYEAQKGKNIFKLKGKQDISGTIIVG